MSNTTLTRQKICYSSTCTNDAESAPNVEKLYDERSPGYLNNHYFVCIDSVENSLMRGRIYHGFVKREYNFCGIIDLLMTIEGLCDRLQAPQSAVFLRKLGRGKRAEHEVKNQSRPQD